MGNYPIIISHRTFLPLFRQNPKSKIQLGGKFGKQPVEPLPDCGARYFQLTAAPAATSKPAAAADD